jgi:hypothetical protein
MKHRVAQGAKVGSCLGASLHVLRSYSSAQGPSSPVDRCWVAGARPPGTGGMARRHRLAVRRQRPDDPGRLQSGGALGSRGVAPDRREEGTPFAGIHRLNRVTRAHLQGKAAISRLPGARVRHQDDGRDAEAAAFGSRSSPRPPGSRGGPMRPGAARSLRRSAVIGDDPGPSARPARPMDTQESARTTKPYGRGADAITLDVVRRIASK